MAAILFGNHILDTFGLTARIFVSHPVPLDFRAPNSAPRIHTRLRTPAAVVSPPPAAPETPSCPEATSALLPGFFHPRLRAPATVVQRPGCTRGPILPGALPRGDFCLAVRQHLKRPPPRSRDIRSQTRRSKTRPEPDTRIAGTASGLFIFAYRRASRNRAGHRASRIGLHRIRQSPPPALRRCEPFTCVWYAAAPPAGGGAPRSAAGTSTSCPCSVWRHWPA